MNFRLPKPFKGFTLVELLVVIAILGILASAVLVAINPLEQLARGRDAGRKSSISQIGNAIQSYYSSQNAIYPTQGLYWLTIGTSPGGTTGLTAAGELKIAPQNPAGGGAYSTGCNNTASYGQNGYCYQTNGTDAIVYTYAESKSSYTAAGCTGTQVAWVAWSSADGKTGLTCAAAGSDPSIGVTGLK